MSDEDHGDGDDTQAARQTIADAPDEMIPPTPDPDSDADKDT